MQYVNDNGIPNRVVPSYDTVFACSAEGGGESAELARCATRVVHPQTWALVYYQTICVSIAGIA